MGKVHTAEHDLAEFERKHNTRHQALLRVLSLDLVELLGLLSLDAIHKQVHQDLSASHALQTKSLAVLQFLGTPQLVLEEVLMCQ
jgi:hypothetical protein